MPIDDAAHGHLLDDLTAEGDELRLLLAGLPRAHGQDVADTIGITRQATDRVAHICHLGVATRGFSHRLRDRPEPTTPVRVELSAPSGRVLQWGPPEAADRIAGPAEDFALVVTQRRHHADTALVATGGPATGDR